MRPVDWKQPKDVVDHLTMQTSTAPWVVFREDPRPEDVVQGGVGNCWFVCALSVLAEHPENIQRLVLTKEYNHIGAYQVRGV